MHSVLDRPVVNLDPDNSGRAGGINFSRSFTENGAPVAIADSDVSVTDNDPTALVSATITLLNPHDGDRLFVSGTLPDGIVASSYDPATGILVLASAPGTTFSDLEAALAVVSFTTDSDDPDPADRLVQVTVSDGLLTSTPDFTVIGVTPLNDAPTGTDRTVTSQEDVPLTLSAADFGFSDIDGNAFAGVLVIALPGSGALLLGGAAVAANTFVTEAQIAAGLLVYVPPPDGAGTALASIGFRVRDDGGVADGGLDTDPTPNELTIDVTAVNDAPQTLVPGPQSLAEDARHQIAGITVSDSDSTQLTTSLVVANGILGVAAPGTVGMTGNGTGSLSLTGTVQEINDALASLSYQPAANYFGPDTLSVSTSDGLASDADLISISVTPVNDAPTIVSGGGGETANLSVLEGTTAVTTVQALDIDSSSLTYGIVGGADADLFRFDALSGVLFFAVAPDFEAPADADRNNIYEVQVGVSDGITGDVQTIFVSVADVAEGSGNPKVDLMLEALAAAGIHSYDQYYLF